VSNILMAPMIYGDFGWWLVPLAPGLALGTTQLFLAEGFRTRWGLWKDARAPGASAIP